MYYLDVIFPYLCVSIVGFYSDPLCCKQKAPLFAQRVGRSDFHILPTMLEPSTLHRIPSWRVLWNSRDFFRWHMGAIRWGCRGFQFYTCPSAHIPLRNNPLSCHRRLTCSLPRSNPPFSHPYHHLFLSSFTSVPSFSTVFNLPSPTVLSASVGRRWSSGRYRKALTLLQQATLCVIGAFFHHCCKAIAGSWMRLLLSSGPNGSGLVNKL